MFDILCPRLVAKIGVCCVTRSSTQHSAVILCELCVLICQQYTYEHRRARLGSRLPVGGENPL